MAGLPRDAGEHGWRRADIVKWTILKGKSRKVSINCSMVGVSNLCF